MKKPLRQMARSAFAKYRGRVRQWFAKPKTSLKPKMNFLEVRKNTANYSVREEKNWRYEDKEDWVKNSLAPANSPHPHIVLCDGKGTPRFVIGYRVDRDIFILAVQRERTQYAKGFFGFRWSAEEETKASKEFQEQLGGIHPSEFLLSEFLYRNRAAIRAGMNVFLYERNPKRYGPLIDRFFKRSTETSSEYHPPKFELSREKRRVKEILEAP